MNRSEIQRVQRYLRTKLNPRLEVKGRERGGEDAAEVELDGEFLAVVFREVDEGEITYQFQMAILEEDVPPLP